MIRDMSDAPVRNHEGEVDGPKAEDVTIMTMMTMMTGRGDKDSGKAEGVGGRLVTHLHPEAWVGTKMTTTVTRVKMTLSPDQCRLEWEEQGQELDSKRCQGTSATCTVRLLTSATESKRWSIWSTQVIRTAATGLVDILVDILAACPRVPSALSRGRHQDSLAALAVVVAMVCSLVSLVSLAQASQAPILACVLLMEMEGEVNPVLAISVDDQALLGCQCLRTYSQKGEEGHSQI